MVFILVFILEIITNFNSKLAEAAGGVTDKAATTVEVPEDLTIPAGLSIPAGGEDLSAGLDIFGTQDMTLISYMIVFVVIVLTVANALAPKFAAGGSNLKFASFLAIM